MMKSKSKSVCVRDGGWFEFTSCRFALYYGGTAVPSHSAALSYIYSVTQQFVRWLMALMFRFKAGGDTKIQEGYLKVLLF